MFDVSALCFYLSFLPSQSTICTHMMMLTIHTFMPIITADNYMDETFFHCNRISSLFFLLFRSNSFFSLPYVNTHFGLRKRKKKRYNWRQNTEFIYDKPKQRGKEKRWPFPIGPEKFIAGCNSYLEPNSEMHYRILIIILRRGWTGEISRDSTLLPPKKERNWSWLAAREIRTRSSQKPYKYFLISLKKMMPVCLVNDANYIVADWVNSVEIIVL